jgi:hypothetical protein
MFVLILFEKVLTGQHLKLNFRKTNESKEKNQELHFI